MAITDDVVNDLKTRIDSTVDALRKEFARVRTGRANLAILDGIRVDYYGAPTPLNGVANMTVADPRLIIVRPWDKKTLPAVEKAIREANIGINPMNDGDIIRLPVPQLTEERRRDMVKMLKADAENARVAIRGVRRDVLADVKEALKEKMITQDEEKSAQTDIQKLTDKYVAEVDQTVVTKEKEVMQV